MAFELPFGVKVLNPKSVDHYYHNDGIPYVSIAEANSFIPSSVRYIGLTVNINNVEYWYKDNTTTLVLKQTGSSSIPFGTKASSTDAGYLGEISIDDDFLYICTTAGSAGSAIWKRTTLMNT